MKFPVFYTDQVRRPFVMFVKKNGKKKRKIETAVLEQINPTENT